MSHWPILVTVHTYLSYFQMYVSSGLVKNFLFNYVPLAWISLGILLYIYIYSCKQWDLLNCKNSTMSHWPILITVYKYLFYFHMCKQWDLLNENSTMSHWKYIPFSIYSIYRILPCKQWDLNPHSFTLLFPKNSLSTNFNMLTLLYTKNPLP